MVLNEQDRALFFKLYFDLLYCVNKKHKIVKKFCGGRYPKSVSPNEAMKIRDKLFGNPVWINEYILAYGIEFTEEEKNILYSWRDHFVIGDFFVMRNLKKYTVFMSSKSGKEAKLYGVIGLNHPIADIFHNSNLPVMVNALILPFKDVIIYDGMMTSNRISFGSNIRGSFNDEYRESKEKFGIIENLPFDESVIKTLKKSVPEKTSSKPTKVSDEKYDEISDLITNFCEIYLNDEYTEMSLRLLEKLRRKRPSPLLKGTTKTWACGIIYAIGSTNFLFDKSQTPHMPANKLSEHFNISKSTAGNKAGEIYKYCDMSVFDPEWTLPSKLSDNPYIWMFEDENGFIFDARTAPLEIQMDLLEQGLIPFIPSPNEIQEAQKNEIKTQGNKKIPQVSEDQISFDILS